MQPRDRRARHLLAPNPQPPESLLDQAAEALFQLGRLFGRMAMPAASTAFPHSVELSRILIVQAVEAIHNRAAQPATVGAIGQHLAIDPSTASRLVAEAIKDGYLLRSASPEDGRRVYLALSDTGRMLAYHARIYQQDVFRQVTRDWTEAERTAFAGLFIRFTEAVTTAVQTQTALTSSQQHKE